MVCKQCGKYFIDDVAVCDECGTVQDVPKDKIAVLYHNNQVVYVEKPVLTNVVSINNNSPKDKKFNLIFSSFVVATICLVFYFVIIPNISVSSDGTQYRTSSNEFDSMNWSSGEFMLDGNYYKLGNSYLKFVSHGWRYDMEEYPFLEDYSLDANEKYPSYINLRNKDYTSASVKVGFVNNGTSIKNIDKCQIWSIVIDNIKMNEQVLFMLPGGINNGSTIEDIYKVYGELPIEHVFKDETNKTTMLEYSDHSIHLDLIIDDKEGLQKICYYKD